MYKIIGADGKEYGPITADHIRQWLHEGRLNGNTKIQPEGATDWKTLRELSEFALLIPPPPAPISMPVAQPVQTNNATAGWALGTGIFAVVCCQVAGPVAIVLGIVALSQLKQNPAQGGRSFAIAGIVLGCCSLLLSIIGLAVFFSSSGFANGFQNAFPH